MGVVVLLIEQPHEIYSYTHQDMVPLGTTKVSLKHKESYWIMSETINYCYFLDNTALPNFEFSLLKSLRLTRMKVDSEDQSAAFRIFS